MQGRQQVAYRVLVEGWSVSAAAREAGVSRATVRLWVERARQSGVAGLQEVSRRPHRLRAVTPVEVQERILDLKSRHPAWGAKKLRARLWPATVGPATVGPATVGPATVGPATVAPATVGPATVAPVTAPVCVRTVERILNRAGLTGVRPRSAAPLQCFEKSRCNELWQMDFKGFEHCYPFRPLSLLDDCSRFCVALHPVARLQGRASDTSAIEALWPVLWEVFGCYGLPESLLCDNGDGFNGSSGYGLTPLEVRLARLGIQVRHGRPRHPQTQGKVERWHRTLEEEWAQLLRTTPRRAAVVAYEQVRQEYNWERPHEALGQQVPGAHYVQSSRPRPSSLPAAPVGEGHALRKVDSCGFFSFRGQSYKAGRGLCGEWVEVREEESSYALFYAGQRLAALQQFRPGQRDQAED